MLNYCVTDILFLLVLQSQNRSWIAYKNIQILDNNN